MPWWMWLVGGVVLMVLELAAVDAAFYLVFLGAAAVVVGVAEAGGAGLPLWGQWVLYAVIAVAAVVFFRQRLYDRLRGGAEGFDNSTVGEIVEITETVPTGGRARIAMRGSQWTATNVGTMPIDAGAQARVVAVSGASVDIEPVPTDGSRPTEGTDD